MEYQFPYIEHLKQVIPAVKGVKEILVRNRGPYTVVNYVVVTPETFPEIGEDNNFFARVRRECRGLIFDSKGELIARPYHKFFNINERAETQEQNVPIADSYILEKLDGSMVFPFYIGGSLYWATRMGITDVAMEAAKWIHVEKKDNIRALANDATLSGYTPIFEYLSKTTPIVIQHEKTDMILTGVRDIREGEYLSYEAMSRLAASFDVPVVKKLPIEELKTINDREDFEGVVINTKRGHKVKVKIDWYVIRHKSRDMITREKDVLKAVVDGTLDDLLGFVDQNDRDKVEKYRDAVTSNVVAYADKIKEAVLSYKGMDRKTFAVEHAPNIKDDFLVSMVYRACWNDPEGYDYISNVLAHIEKHCGTGARVEQVRYMFGGVRWEDFYKG